jgi:hypothetical protein
MTSDRTSGSGAGSYVMAINDRAASDGGNGIEWALC